MDRTRLPQGFVVGNRTVLVNKITRVWRLRNDRYKVHSTIATTKHDKMINIWDYFCLSGVGELYSVDGILLREQYKKNEYKLLPCAKKFHRR